VQLHSLRSAHRHANLPLRGPELAGGDINSGPPSPAIVDRLIIHVQAITDWRYRVGERVGTPWPSAPHRGALRYRVTGGRSVARRTWDPAKSTDCPEHRTGLIRVLRMDGVQDMQDYSSPIHEIHDCVDRLARAAVGRYAGNEERR